METLILIIIVLLILLLVYIIMKLFRTSEKGSTAYSAPEISEKICESATDISQTPAVINQTPTVINQTPTESAPIIETAVVFEKNMAQVYENEKHYLLYKNRLFDVNKTLEFLNRKANIDFIVKEYDEINDKGESLKKYLLDAETLISSIMVRKRYPLILLWT